MGSQFHGRQSLSKWIQRVLFINSGFLILAFESPIWATEYRTFYDGVRGLAMGGAQIATVNDETALIVNPAALGKLRNFYGTILDPEVEISSNFGTFYTSKSFSSVFDPTDIVPTLQASPEEPYHASAQILPSFVGRNFGIGLYARYVLDGQTDSSGNTLNYLYYRNDLAFVLGYNLRFFDGRIKLGFNARMVSRIESNLTNVDLTSNPNLAISNIGQEGFGMGLDGALMLAAPWKMIPTLAVVVRDMGGTSFEQSRGVRPMGNASLTAPSIVSQDADVALALFPIHSPGLRSSWTIEYRGALSAAQETDPQKRIHFGYELNLRDLVFLRAGYHQRYFSGGMELASENFQFQVATYGEEIGTAGANLEDRRYVGKIAFRF